MRIVGLRTICAAVLGMLGGLAASQAAPAQGCPCFHYNGAEVHETYTEYSAKNDCPGAVNFRSKATQIGWTKWFEKGETKKWRCDGGTDMCGELTWQRVDSCPTSAQESPEPRRKSSKRKPRDGAGSARQKAADQPAPAAPAR